MYRLYSSLAAIISTVALFGCASSAGVSARSWDFPVEGSVSSISHVDLGAAIAAANATRVYRVRVINRDRVRVDISDDLHEVGDYDEKGRYFLRRIHGDPMYVIVTRIGGKWESGGAIITTY
jgi:hypothetical protein